MGHGDVHDARTGVLSVLLSPVAGQSHPRWHPPANRKAVVSSDRKGRSMLRAKWVGLLAVVSGFLAAAPCRAVEPVADTPAKTYAVLVGVSNYTDPQILPRKHAEADSQALYDLVTDKTYLCAAPADVKLLLGGTDEKRHAEPATKANVVKAIAEAAQKAGKDDLVLIALIGQGAEMGDK